MTTFVPTINTPSGLLSPLMQAMEAVPRGMIWIEEDGKILGANTVFKALYNLPKTISSTSTIFQFTPALQASDWQDKWAQLLENKQVEIETMFVSPVGMGTALRMCAVLIHIGEQRVCFGIVANSQTGVLPTEEMYIAQYCLDNVKEMVYWVDTNGDLHYVNQQMCNTLNYTRKELLGMNIKQLRSDFNETRWQYQWEEFRKGKTLELEVKFKNKDNQELPIQVTGYYLKYRELEIACIFGKDMRVEKRREEILRLSRYSLNHTQEMIYWIREDGSFHYFNDAFASKLGYTREEVKQMNLVDFFPGFKQADFQAGWQRLRNGEILSSEIQIFHRNGFFIPIQTYVTLVSIEGEICACGILSDISERRRKELELKEAFSEIQRLQAQYESDNLVLKEEIAFEHPFNNIITTTVAYNKILKQIEQLASTDVTVLLLGEMGTGKELLARALHQLSRRSNRPVVKVNCSGIAEHLIERELFGYEKDAFPDAFQQKKGRLELADGGTLFLDEIGALPLNLQGKLLRVLQEGRFERLGSTETVTVNVRVVAATNRNLALLVEKHEFRKDLFYRLNLFSIPTLPLRERRADIPLLTKHFVKKFAQKMGKALPTVPPAALDKLMQYDFPGNIRELENILERAVLLSNNGLLNLDAVLSTASPTITVSMKSLEQIQRDHIIEALRSTKGQVTGENGAAKLLKMNDKTLYSKIQKLKIERQHYLQ